MSPPELVTLDVWRVPGRLMPRALTRVAFDRWSLRRIQGLRFAKLLGTGAGSTFAPRDGDPRAGPCLLLGPTGTRAGVRAAPRSPLAGVGCRRAVAVRPPTAPSRGRWARPAPFGAPNRQRWDGPVAAITRARLAPSRAATFWRAIPGGRRLGGAAGCARVRPRRGPDRLQGTFSAGDRPRCALRLPQRRTGGHRTRRSGGTRRSCSPGSLSWRRTARSTKGPAGMTTSVDARRAAPSHGRRAGGLRRRDGLSARGAAAAPRFVVAHTQRPASAGWPPWAMRRARTIAVGFGYGYRGAPGQWWHDEVRAGCTPRPANAGCPILRAVRAACTARRIGTRHRPGPAPAIADGLQQRTVMLSTPEGEIRGLGGSTAGLASSMCSATTLPRRRPTVRGARAALPLAAAGCVMPLATIGVAASRRQRPRPDRVPAGRWFARVALTVRDRGDLLLRRPGPRAASPGDPGPALPLLRSRPGAGCSPRRSAVATGFPFGDLHLRRLARAAVLGVPLVIPLAWTMMAWPALRRGRG